jgi:hypothetical protein
VTTPGNVIHVNVQLRPSFLLFVVVRNSSQFRGLMLFCFVQVTPLGIPSFTNTFI